MTMQESIARKQEKDTCNYLVGLGRKHKEEWEKGKQLLSLFSHEKSLYKKVKVNWNIKEKKRFSSASSEMLL